MEALRQVFSRTVLVLCLTILAVEAVVFLSQWGRQPAPHRVPLAIAAPAVLGQEVAAAANAQAGHPFTLRIMDDAEAAKAAEQARRAVRSGTSFAAVALDLTGEADTLYLPTTADPDLARATESRIRAVEGGYGRQLRVARVAPGRNPQLGRAAAPLLTGAWVVMGFVCSAALTVVRGPAARTFRLAAARVVGLAAASAVLAVVPALFTGLSRFPLVWAVGAGTVLAAAWTTLALESLAKLAGIGLAGTLFVLLAGPEFTLSDPRLLPEPWASVTPWTLHGAAQQVAERVLHFDAAPVLRALCVLAAWIWLPLLTMAVARRERVRDQTPTADSSWSFS
jgi:hypothetical protein